MEELTKILGVLGAYFAVLLVLAVSVETILEPFTWFKGLSKKVSPDEALKDVKDWLPDDPTMAASASANAIANLTKEYNVVLADVNERVDKIKTIAAETSKGLGITKPVDDLETKLAVYMSALRTKYSVDERTRITILRLLSALIGILIAVLLKINTFDILGGLFPEEVQQTLSIPVAQYGGLVLTGLAASAGSNFWHDQLGKLRAIKNAATQLSGGS
jgi:hypothetical protein